jgi:hypothetical protein
MGTITKEMIEAMKSAKMSQNKKKMQVSMLENFFIVNCGGEHSLRVCPVGYKFFKGYNVFD